MRKLILAVVLLALAPGSGFAQSQTDFWTNLAQLKVGKKVQVVDSDLNKVKGRLLDISGDDITLEVDKEEVVIPRWKVTLVSVKKSKTEQMLRGFLSGAVAAAPALMDPYTISQIAYGGRGGTTAAIMLGAGAAALGLAEALEVDTSDKVLYFSHDPRKRNQAASAGSHRQPVGSRPRVRVRPKGMEPPPVVQSRPVPNQIAVNKQEHLPPPGAPLAQEPIRVGGQVQSARLTYQTRPVYPSLARQARIQGTVRIEAVISRNGTVENLEVLSGHPLLNQAALDAVRQWRYQPTLLNGVAVEVITTIDVNFTMR